MGENEYTAAYSRLMNVIDALPETPPDDPSDLLVESLREITMRISVVVKEIESMGDTD